MKAKIVHESKGRIRIQLHRSFLSIREADLLEEWIRQKRFVKTVAVHERTASVTITYKGDRSQVIDAIREFKWEKAEETVTLSAHNTRELNREFQEKLVMKVCKKAFSMLFLPKPLRIARVIWHMVPFMKRGLGCLFRRQMKVELLDALSIGISACRGDFSTAGTVMFLLEIGELLEEWTRRRSIEDLARCMSLNVDRVWLHTDDGDILTPISQISVGDEVVVRMGGIIPFDAEVIEGEVMVNQASLTGESIPVAKYPGGTVYAGTVVEEGDCIIKVKQASGQGRYDQIVSMIENSQQMKSAAENKASNLADKLVPYTFLGTVLSYVLTGNIVRAVSVLMVDFSCALKLAMPLAVLSAMREAGKEHITVKGGKYLEAVAQADTIVFDKTGTLTYATPKVVQIETFGGRKEEDMLRLAACLEEHFPHSLANAIVDEAAGRGLTHEEFHTKVQYLVAHGIASTVNGTKVIIGSYHFVFEDEKCTVPEEEQAKFDSLPPQYSHLFLGIGNELAAVICIADPLREEAKDAMKALRALGLKHTVMLTGDSYRTAEAIAEEVGVNEFQAEVLPEDKASYVAKMRAEGHKVIMVGDGINDSPALSEADAGIAISDGAAIAREIADITIAAESLWELVKLRQIALGLEQRIKRNYRFVIGFNSALIALGVMGVLAPATSAMFHNVSTLCISLESMTTLPKKQVEGLPDNLYEE